MLQAEADAWSSGSDSDGEDQEKTRTLQFFSGLRIDQARVVSTPDHDVARAAAFPVLWKDVTPSDRASTPAPSRPPTPARAASGSALAAGQALAARAKGFTRNLSWGAKLKRAAVPLEEPSALPATSRESVSKRLGDEAIRAIGSAPDARAPDLRRS